MASTATITISGQVASLPQGSVTLNVSLVNSTAVGASIYSTLSSAGTSTNGPSFQPPPDCKYVLIIPPSTNTQPFRVGPSTASTGLLLSSAGANLLSIGSTATTFYLWTTGTLPINNLQTNYY